MHPDDTVAWYEASLPLTERRMRGHFSTPPLLVERILDACGYTACNNLSSLRVLDPACGSGNFLLGAAHRLLQSSIQSGLSLRQSQKLVEQNIRGFDPDPISCFLSEMRLRSLLSDNASCSGKKKTRRPLRLHVHQADALTLPWQPCVDLFLANPPYLAAKNTDLSGYRATHARGQSDGYLLFLNLAFHALKPGGWLGLVLPDPLLARANASEERKYLLEHFTIHHLWHLANVFSAQVGAVVIVAQHTPPSSTHAITWVRSPWRQLSTSLSASVSQCVVPSVGTMRGQLASVGKEGEAGQNSDCVQKRVMQSLLRQQPGAELRYLLSEDTAHIFERLRVHLATAVPEKRCFAPLSDFLSIRRGEELGKESRHLFLEEKVNRDIPSYPVLRGGVDIRPYGTPATSWRIASSCIAKPVERYLAPKLLVVKSTDRLQAMLDTQGHVVLQTLYLLYPCRADVQLDDLYFFLALLNSRFLQQYVHVLYTAYKWVQPQIEQHVLASLPVPLLSSEERQPIIDRAKLIVQACSHLDPVVEWNQDIQNIYEAQERTIATLYASLLQKYFADKGVNAHG